MRKQKESCYVYVKIGEIIGGVSAEASKKFLTNNLGGYGHYIDINKLSLYDSETRSFMITHGLKRHQQSFSSWVKVVSVYLQGDRSPSEDKIISDALLESLQSLKSGPAGGAYNSLIPGVLAACADVFSPEEASKVIVEVVRTLSAHDVAARQVMIKAALAIACRDEEYISILSASYKIISNEDFDFLIAAVTDGIDNPGIKEILSKTKLFRLRNYDKKNVSAGSSARTALIRGISKSPGRAKRMKFCFEFSVDDLNTLPPVARFKLIRWYYAPYIHAAGSYVDDYALEVHKEKELSPAHKNISFGSIGRDDIVGLLLSIALKKNVKVSGFMRLFDWADGISRGVNTTSHQRRVLRTWKP